MTILHVLFLLLISALAAIGCGGVLIEKFGKPALDGFEPSAWNDVLVSLFAVVSAIIIFRSKIARNSRGTLRDAALFVLTFYLTCRLLHGNLLIPTALCSDIKYADITVAITAIILIKIYLKEGTKAAPKQKVSEILADSNEEEDLLSRKAEADALAIRLIRNRNTESSIGVSITGAWGLGKTYFLHLLKEKLEDENQTVFFFNPWHCNNDDIVAMFFDELENHIQGEEESRIIRRYARLLARDGNSLWRIVDGLCNGKSLSERQERLKSMLASSTHKYFVLMDDCDRLDKEELKNSVSLIRTVANLPNMVFIAAFDEQKVKEILEDYDSDSYLNKMFNLNHPLLPLTNDDIVSYIMPHIKARFKNEDVYTAVEKGNYKLIDKSDGEIKLGDYPEYNYFDGIRLNELLPTFREVKRYLNLLLDDYGQMQKVVEGINFCNADFVLLELIKYKDQDLYLTLRDNPRQILDIRIKRAWCSPCYELKNEKQRNDAVGSVLKHLFEKDRCSNNPFSVRSVTYYRCYFSKTLPTHIITKAEFAHLYDEGIDYVPILNQWIKDGKQNFLSLLYGKERTAYADNLMEILATYVYIVCDNLHTDNTLSLIRRGWNGNEKEYRHSYEVIKTVVAENPIIWEICFQSVGDPTNEENEDRLYEYVKNSQYKLELIAIFLQEIRDLDHSDGTYIDAQHLFLQLWNDYLGSSNVYDAHMTDNIIQILLDCLHPEITENVVKPLLKKNLEHWIGHTVVKLSDGDNKYLFLDNTSLLALFETYDNAQKILKTLMESPDADHAMLDEYRRMLTYFYSHRNHVRATDLEESKYPRLAQLPQQLFDIKPFSAAAQEVPQEFWDGKTYRKYERVEYYFA